MSSKLRKIYLVRHAESIWNEERRIQGSCIDVPLSDTGRNQARMLGRRLGELSFGSVYSSDAVRALETARIALGDDHSIKVMSELRELNLGDWEGRLVSEIKEEYPGEVERWYKRPSGIRINGGENIGSFRRRSVAVIERIVKTSNGADVLVITHGGIICTYLTSILNMNLDDLWSLSLPNASITTVVFDFRPRLRSFGDTAHLSGGAMGLDGMPSSL